MSEKNSSEIIVAAIIGAFSLMMALAWNDTAKVVIEKYVTSKSGDSVRANVIYTLVVTAFAVVVILALQKRENLIKMVKK